MKDIPITNNELEVEAVGFKKFEKYELGVLITPWFMNNILIPEIKDDIYQDTSHKKITIGDKIDIKFSAKSYTFLAQKDDTLGFYLSCSLYFLQCLTLNPKLMQKQ